ncbi:MAG: hypothetical protein ACOY94_16065 [Bacillota bacterium]
MSDEYLRGEVMTLRDLIVGALLGGLMSWLITHLYHLRQVQHERDARQAIEQRHNELCGLIQTAIHKQTDTKTARFAGDSRYPGLAEMEPGVLLDLMRLTRPPQGGQEF